MFAAFVACCWNGGQLSLWPSQPGEASLLGFLTAWAGALHAGLEAHSLTCLSFLFEGLDIQSGLPARLEDKDVIEPKMQAVQNSSGQWQSDWEELSHFVHQRQSENGELTVTECWQCWKQSSQPLRKDSQVLLCWQCGKWWWTRAVPQSILSAPWWKNAKFMRHQRQSGTVCLTR